MGFNWGKALTGGVQGALAGYSSVLQGEVQQEWFAQQQKVLEERERSMYELKRNTEAPDRAAAEARLDKADVRADKSLGFQERQLGVTEEQARLAAENQKLDNARADKALSLQEQEYNLRVSELQASKEKAGKAIVGGVYKKNEDGSYTYATQKDIESGNYVKPEEAVNIEADIKAQAEAKATIANVNAKGQELINLGASEKEVIQWKKQVIAGVKASEDKGVSQTDIFKAINDGMKEATAAGEDPKEAYKSVTSRVFASLETAGGTTPGVPQKTEGALSSPPSKIPKLTESETRNRAQMAVKEGASYEEVLAKDPINGPSMVNMMKGVNQSSFPGASKVQSELQSAKQELQALESQQSGSRSTTGSKLEKELRGL